MQIALVSREVHPLGGGGIGAYVAALAEVLSEVAEVTIVTTDRHESRYAELRDAGSEELPPTEVSFAFVPEPTEDDLPGYGHPMHLWGVRVLAELSRLYPDGGPDLVEVPDYLGEGCVLAQARRTCDPRLRNTILAVRLHTTAEIAMVLNGYLAKDARLMFDLERYALRNADAALWAGGEILAAYERYYGKDCVAEPHRIRHPVASSVASAMSPQPQRSSDTDRLRLLFAGRLERRKGVHVLLEAVCALAELPIELTLVGSDSASAPLGQSMRHVLELQAADDPRIVFHDGIDRRGLLELMEGHDAIAMPSIWECWPNVALEALAVNRPVVATASGGYVEMLEPGASGWLAADASGRSLQTLLRRLLDERQTLERSIGDRLPRKRFETLVDAAEIRSGYADLVEGHRSRRAPARAPRAPLVSAIVPYFRLHDYVEEALASLVAQTYAPLEIILVNDGSFDPVDEVVVDLAERYPIRVVTQSNSGVPAARNFGIALARGTYVFPLDADNIATPTFVERAVAVLDDHPETAYVTSWLKFVDRDGNPVRDGWGAAGGYPIGSQAASLETVNVAGDTASVLRKTVFEAGFSYSPTMAAYEDWALYRQLAEAGWYGHVIPEELLIYRIRAESMLRQVGERHHERLLGEMEALLREPSITGRRQ